MLLERVRDTDAVERRPHHQVYVTQHDRPGHADCDLLAALPELPPGQDSGTVDLSVHWTLPGRTRELSPDCRRDERGSKRR
jgi:hypothetical protein